MRLLLLSIALLTAATPIFGKEAELSEATKATLGKVVAETLRPDALLSYQLDALKFNRGEIDQATLVRILQGHAASLGLSAAHCEVISDEANDPVVETLARQLGQSRRRQAVICENLKAPDAAADFSKFLLQSMFFSALAKDRKEADQLVLGAAFSNSMNHVVSQAKVSGDWAQFQENETQILKTLEDFTKRHPSLDSDAAFAKATNKLLADHTQRGKKAAQALSANSTAFYQSLIGQQCERAKWNFESVDKLISLTILSQKAIGTCVCSDCQLVVQGGRSNETRAINFKVVHRIYKDGTRDVIDVY
jgi:hypothetical protein